jgi:hypothetical protein
VDGGSPHASSLVEEAQLVINGVSFGYLIIVNFLKSDQALHEFIQDEGKRNAHIHLIRHAPSAIFVLLRDTFVPTPNYQNSLVRPIM